MRFIEFNWQPSDRQLRQFGLVCAVALPLLGWIWGAGQTLFTGLIIVGVAVAILGFTASFALKPVFVTMMLVATPVGMVIGELAMATIFFGVFLPFGLVFRIIGRDALQRSIDKKVDTYWQRKMPPADAASYYRQS